MDITSCTLCPRKCHANRTLEQGFCGGGSLPKLARAGLHFWEEPCISGSRGSGAVFFSGCSLKCCYCQNKDISSGNFGAQVSVERLEEIFLELQENGAHNINLVTATQYIPWIKAALDAVRGKLIIPIVYNSSGYETLETVEGLAGYVDIYLPDLKYKSSELAAKYSGAGDYFAVATKAILAMYSQVGGVKKDVDGMLKSGVIVRHLALPGSRLDGAEVLEWLAESFPSGEVLLSLMSQFTPQIPTDFKQLQRRISTFEYNFLLAKALDLELFGFMQEKSAAKAEFTPEFDLFGVNN